MTASLSERAVAAEEAGDMKAALALWREFAVGDEERDIPLFAMAQRL